MFFFYQKRMRIQDLDVSQFATASEYLIAKEIRELKEREEELHRSRSERGLPSLEVQTLSLGNYLEENYRKRSSTGARVSSSTRHCHCAVHRASNTFTFKHHPTPPTTSRQCNRQLCPDGQRLPVWITYIIRIASTWTRMRSSCTKTKLHHSRLVAP